MIHAEDLSKRYGLRRAVDRVTFTAPDGCITGLLGANGAGKTTTFRIISGLMHAEAGRVLIDGVDGGDRRARRLMGVLPHGHGLYGRLEAREQLAYFGALRGLAGSRLDRRIADVMEGFGLTPLAHRRTQTFSEGERVRLALACAMVHQPRTLVLDEPTSGLDVMSVRALHERLRTARTEGACILFSSHVMHEAAALCDCIVLIAGGRIAAEGTPNELRRQAGCDEFEDAFVALTSATRVELEAAS